MEPTSTAKILVADDQQPVLDAVKLLLKSEGLACKTVQSAAQVLAALESGEVFDAVLVDLNYTRDTTSGREGLDLLPRIQALDATLPVLVMTAWGSVDSAVEAMRRGARDYVEKPFNNARLIASLRTQVELSRALRRSRNLEEQNRLLEQEVPEMVALSPAMQPVLELIERIGPSGANVLVTGEHGTGKEVVARRLHAVSSRAKGPLVCVDSGGLSDGVFESEMFGHVKGAFTDARADRVGCFELADGGTLFLDEVGNLPLNQQAKLLRVIQTGEVKRVGSSRAVKVDVRVVSATNADLPAEAAQKRFREDLLYRLNTVELRLPPLRDRREDIRPLADSFLARLARRYRKPEMGFSKAALSAMEEYGWPGNVRELEHAVERAVLLAKGDAVEAADLRLGAPSAGAGGSIPDNLKLEEAERWYIERTLSRCDQNVNRAAEALGISRSSLYRRLRQTPEGEGADSPE